ncbi:hypothetical protein AB1N83_007891 [Pleurotus pulmonarius]
MLIKENLSPWVEIEGVATHEYNIEVKEDGTHVTCWIASEEGKSFSIHIKDASCSIATCWSPRIDGVETPSLFLDPSSGGDFREQLACLDAVQVSPTEQRGLVFSSMNITDDDSYLNRPSHINAGEISLCVWTTAPTGKEGTSNFVQLPDGPVHEKSKKSGAHCVNLGEAQPTDIGEGGIGEVWERLKQIATFTFKYRPLGLLQAKGIAPPPPRAPVCPKSEESDLVAAGELEVLKRQIQIMQERLTQLEKPRGAKRVKEEPGLGERRARKRLKEEPKSTTIPGEVIDLTSD